MRQKPLQARSRHTVEAIVDATMLEIAERGLAGLTTTQVAERAGASVGSLYQYFADKEALLDAVVRRLTAELQQLLLEQFSALMGQDLRSISRAMISVAFDYTAKHQNLVRELLSADSQRRTMGSIEALERSFLDAFRLYVLQHYREISAPNLPTATFVAFTSAICTGFRYATTSRPGVERDAVIDLLVETVVVCLTHGAAIPAPADAAEK